MAIWVLEKLPDDVHVDTLVMLACAMSPQYDLSPALRHVSGKAYVFVSPLDPINRRVSLIVQYLVRPPSEEDAPKSEAPPGAKAGAPAEKPAEPAPSPPPK